MNTQGTFRFSILTCTLICPLLLLSLLFLPLRNVAHAATFNAACIGTVGDSASLATAIDDANATLGVDTIELGANCTYSLTAALPTITEDAVVQGNGAKIVRDAGFFRLLTGNATPPVTLTVHALTLSNGIASGSFGGAIYTNGKLNIYDSRIEDSVASYSCPGSIPSNGQGGGAYASQDMLIVNSVLVNNSGYAGSGAYGAGDLTLENTQILSQTAFSGSCGTGLDTAFVVNGDLTATDSVIAYGADRRIALVNGNATISGTAVFENGSVGSSGGVQVDGSLWMTNTRISDHTGSGLRVNGSNATIVDSHFENNSVYAVYVDVGTLTMTNTQVLTGTYPAGSTASGVFVGSDATIADSRIQGQSRGLTVQGMLVMTGSQLINNGHCGAINVVDSAEIHNTTFSGNSDYCAGGGIVGGSGLYSSSPVTLTGVSADHNLASNRSVFYASGGATLTVHNAHFSDNSSKNGTLQADNINVTDSTFLRNSATEGGAIWSNGTVNVTGSHFEHNSTTGSGSAIRGGTITLSDTQIISNTGVQGSVNALGTVTVNASRIERNVNSSGAAISGVSVVVTHADFYSNTSPSPAAIFQSTSGTLAITSSHFENNRSTATARPGAVEGSGTFSTISDTTFINNHGDEGGALEIRDGAIMNSHFEDNSSVRAAGAVLSDHTIEVHGTTFRNNRANAAFSSQAHLVNGGGALKASNLIMSDSHFDGNHSTDDAGAVFVRASSNISRTTFVSNSADSHGGALVIGFNGTHVATNLQFDGNRAVYGGHAYYAFCVTDCHLGSTTLQHATITSGTLTSGFAVLAYSKALLSVRNTIIDNYTGGMAGNNGHGGNDLWRSADSLLFHNVATPFSNIGNQTNTVVGDPVFVDAANGDYRLAAGSHAIDAGNDFGVTQDFEGEARPQGDAPDIGYDESPFVTHCFVEDGNDYAFDMELTVTVTVNSTSDLDCITLRRIESDHPQAATAQQTGRYWQISGTDSAGVTVNGFDLSLTLPHDGLAAPEVCRYTGSDWDCAVTSFDDQTATRAGITAFSDWAIGAGVPTAVEMGGESADLTHSHLRQALFSFTLLLTLMTLICWAQTESSRRAAREVRAPRPF